MYPSPAQNLQHDKEAEQVWKVSIYYYYYYYYLYATVCSIRI